MVRNAAKCPPNIERGAMFQKYSDDEGIHSIADVEGACGDMLERLLGCRLKFRALKAQMSEKWDIDDKEKRT